MNEIRIEYRDGGKGWAEVRFELAGEIFKTVRMRNNQESLVKVNEMVREMGFRAPSWGAASSKIWVGYAEIDMNKPLTIVRGLNCYTGQSVNTVKYNEPWNVTVDAFVTERFAARDGSIVQLEYWPSLGCWLVFESR